MVAPYWFVFWLKHRIGYLQRVTVLCYLELTKWAWKSQFLGCWTCSAKSECRCCLVRVFGCL